MALNLMFNLIFIISLLPMTLFKLNIIENRQFISNFDMRTYLHLHMIYIVH